MGDFIFFENNTIFAFSETIRYYIVFTELSASVIISLTHLYVKSHNNMWLFERYLAICRPMSIVSIILIF